MRNISFALTTSQFLDGSKTVTRRLGWKSLKPGDILCAVEKSQGLKKGEKVRRLGMIRVTLAYQERLGLMIDDQDYGETECVKEGFPEYFPEGFVAMFCKFNGCTPLTVVTRIEFERISPTPGEAG